MITFEKEQIMSKKEFKPYVPADSVTKEMTVFSIILGCILAVIFGGANAYLGLRVGLTISASIPAAVVSMGIVRKIFKRDSILENNMVQTIGSAGESLAAGAIFTMPALFIWAKEGLTDMPSMLDIGIIAFCGGVLGVLLMIPLRNALIVQEHGTLGYPEGTACAEVLMAGEQGGSKSSMVFAGLGISAVYKFIADGLKLFPSEINWTIPAYKGAGFGLNILPALTGVGYICGAKVSSYMFSGGVLAWLVIMPLIVLFGSDAVIFPAEISVAEVWKTAGTGGIWGNYVRYIGAGALIAGGVISLVKSLPTIITTFAKAFKSYGKNQGNEGAVIRTEQDISMKAILIGCVAVAMFMWLYPGIPVSLLSAFLILVFGFFFATVSSRMVGVIGSSNNPVSGMAIATLLFATLILKATGNTGASGMVGAIAIGSVICIVAAMAGDISQDLKCGFLVGATPRKQQYGELLGSFASAIAIGAILYLLNAAYGFGSEELGAPQAMMMKMVVEGVMNGTLPWALVFTGVFIAVVIQLLGLPVLPIAIGIYLPISLSAPIMVGGLVRLIVEKMKYRNNDEKENAIQSGVLYSSGMIAGEGILGIILAVLAIIKIKGVAISEMINLSNIINLGSVGGIAFFTLLTVSFFIFAFAGKKTDK